MAAIPIVSYEDGGNIVEDTLVCCGNSAINPTLDAIKKEVWGRGFCHYPGILHRLGAPAHGRLLETIDAETSPDKRARLISSLQMAFDDYSRLGMWVDMAIKGQEAPWSTFWLSAEISRALPDAPPVLEKNDLYKLNPDFIKWWREGGRFTKPAVE